ncbi:MAG TPA: hypothetical protein VFX41_10675 [Actinomycetales bacterium]|jgi:hypothetical protein|nr:hypothetical protein [Actinomycetales bacterium]
MLRRRRGPRIPDDVRAAAGLDRGEQVLAAAHNTDGAWTLATDSRLLLVRGDEVVLDRPWWQVDTAGWDGDSGVMSIMWVGGASTWLELAEDSQEQLPRVLRERVDSTVVAVQHVKVEQLGSARAGGARLVARRIEGELRLQVLLNKGTDPTDPAVVAALDDGRAALEDMVGPLAP